jgi:hypothetical protein
MSVTLDTSRVEAMLERIVEHVRANFTEIVLDVAEQGARQVTGIPRDTGALADSVHATPGRRPSPNSALIVSDLEHARFVFARQRPTLPAGALARELADRVARQVFA